MLNCGTEREMIISKLRYLITNYRQMGHFVNVQMSITWRLLSSRCISLFFKINSATQMEAKNLCSPKSPFVRVSAKLI